MKPQTSRVKSVFFFFGISLLFGCNSSSNKTTDNRGFENMSEADSLKVVSELFDAMEDEIYSRYLTVDQDTNLVEYTGCGRPNILIRVNSLNQTMVNDEIGAPITERIIEFYSANMKKNDVTNIFPMYTHNRLKDVEHGLQEATRDAEEFEIKDSVATEVKEFKRTIVEEWRKKKKVFKTLGIESLPEVHAQAHIRIEYTRNTAPRPEIVDSVILAIYTLRDRRAQEYLNESYIEIYQRYSVTKKRSG